VQVGLPGRLSQSMVAYHILCIWRNISIFLCDFSSINNTIFNHYFDYYLFLFDLKLNLFH
jgi:hypothetical protein